MEEVKIKVPAGKFLIQNSACPNGCSLINKKKLISNNPAITALARVHGASGLIHFSPYYGDFRYECEIELPQGEIIGVYCPHCNASLAGEIPCGMCQIPMFVIHLRDGGEVRACPTIGCRNHHLTIVDLDAQFADFYNEERRPKM